MNNHLNIFRFFNENDGTLFIENNLSRAFALCLKNDPLFFHKYSEEIVSKEDYEYLFGTINDEAKYIVDIQRPVASIDYGDIRKVYAVAMTTDEALQMNGFLQQTYSGRDGSITDVFVTVKDIAFVVEVKRSGEDCRSQLYDQVYPFIKENIEVIAVNVPWQKTIGLMEKVMHTNRLGGMHSVFITDFVELSQFRYPQWFKTKPFNALQFSNKKGTAEYYHLMNRMRQALSKTGLLMLEYSDRMGVRVDYGWATEVIPEFALYTDGMKEYVNFYIWPGNTKGQGWQVYNKPVDWMNKEHLQIGENQYELDIAFNVKLSHFNRYVAGFTFYGVDVAKPLHTAENFDKLSGKWNIDNWEEFESIMDEYFPVYQWKKMLDWQNKFLNSDRNYFTLSLGFEVALCVPYDEFKAIDKRDEDVDAVAEKLKVIIEGYKTLLD